MGSHTSKSGGGGGGISASETQTETARGGAPIGRLQRLTADSSRADIREALRSIPADSTFYRYRVGSQGELLSDFDEITRTRNGDFRVGNRTVTEDQMASSIYRGTTGTGNFHTEFPDTSSSFAITGRKVTTHDGLQYRNGTYDTLNRASNGNIRKFSEKGQITSYDGENYGVTKKGGKYTITHAGTGLSMGTVKTMSEVSARIKEYSDRVKRLPDKRKSEERFANTLRGTR